MEELIAEENKSGNFFREQCLLNTINWCCTFPMELFVKAVKTHLLSEKLMTVLLPSSSADLTCPTTPFFFFFCGKS